jgi:hypothetical protein
MTSDQDVRELLPVVFAKCRVRRASHDHGGLFVVSNQNEVGVALYRSRASVRFESRDDANQSKEDQIDHRRLSKLPRDPLLCRLPILERISSDRLVPVSLNSLGDCPLPLVAVGRLVLVEIPGGENGNGGFEREGLEGLQVVLVRTPT